MKSKHKPVHTIDTYRNQALVKLLLIIMLLISSSCEDFIEIDPPNDQLTGEIVFEDAATVNAALVHIYAQLRDNALTTGGTSGLTYLLGNYADELTLYSTDLQDARSFYENNLSPSNGTVLALWNNSYNLIFAVNNIIEGIQNSTALTQVDKDRFLGEAYFLRALIHFYLVNLFGEIPYIEITDYSLNSQVSKLGKDLIYQKLIDDLVLSKSLLSADYIGIDRVRPNKWVAAALLARVYLYNQNWELAVSEATQVISDGGYVINSDINQVFLKNSTETLWQFDAGFPGSNTIEALTYIFTSGPPPSSALSSHLINSFEIGDARLANWIGTVSDGNDTWYHPFKYKLNANTGTTQECSIIFRLAEIYLIAAEANAQLGNTSTALNQLNALRDRANLVPVLFANKETILNAIYHERRIEFFTEQAHRFFDLKRTDRANSQLLPVKPNWQTTDVLLPLPESELILNPNMQPQNEGY